VPVKAATASRSHYDYGESEAEPGYHDHYARREERPSIDRDHDYYKKVTHKKGLSLTMRHTLPCSNPVSLQVVAVGHLLLCSSTEYTFIHVTPLHYTTDTSMPCLMPQTQARTCPARRCCLQGIACCPPCIHVPGMCLQGIACCPPCIHVPGLCLQGIACCPPCIHACQVT
jgi:hypothetical protein